MPDASLPSSLLGWLVATLAALAGLLAGLAVIKLLRAL
jgi:hypothetical protein